MWPLVATRAVDLITNLCCGRITESDMVPSRERLGLDVTMALGDREGHSDQHDSSGRVTALDTSIAQAAA